MHDFIFTIEQAEQHKALAAEIESPSDKVEKKSNDEFVKKLSYLPETLNCKPEYPAQKREDLFIVRLEEILNTILLCIISLEGIMRK